MKRLIISESERKDILRKHGTVIYEQTADEKLRQIQQALGTSGDKVIGPDTTKKIVDALKSAPKKTAEVSSDGEKKDETVSGKKDETVSDKKDETVSDKDKDKDNIEASNNLRIVSSHTRW